MGTYFEHKEHYTVRKEAIVDVHKEGKCYQDINKSLIMPIYIDMA